MKICCQVLYKSGHTVVKDWKIVENLKCQIAFSGLQVGAEVLRIYLIEAICQGPLFLPTYWINCKCHWLTSKNAKRSSIISMSMPRIIFVLAERKVWKTYFFKNGQNPASFCLFLFFSIDKHYTNTINEKSIDGVLGTRTQGGRMVGEDKSTELWRHPKSRIFGLHKLKKIFKLFHLVIDF